MSDTELQVVCRSCGREVSPYVTECPYCGTRLRKRAPRLEHRDGSLEPRKPTGSRFRQMPKPRWLEDTRPLASLVLTIGPAVLLLVGTLAGLDRVGMGAVQVPGLTEWWRFLAAPFVYGDVGFLFVVGVATLLFGPPLERRLGTVPVAVMLVACGALGILGATLVDDQRGVEAVIAGGNGLAAGAVTGWWAVERTRCRRSGEEFDPIPVAVAAVVVLLIPLLVFEANPWVAPIGGAVGAIAGRIAEAFRK